MTKKEYNGWFNYETWLMALWIGNEEGSSRYWDEQAEDCWESTDEDDPKDDREEEAVRELADRLENEFEEANPLASQASFWADMMNAALGEVNWDEIAEGMIADVDKD